MQHCWPTAPYIVECYMLCPLAHPIARCCNVVAQTLKLVKLLAGVQMDTTTLNIVRQTMLRVIVSICTYSLKTSNFIHITLPQ